jgi:hypothetical protein
MFWLLQYCNVHDVSSFMELECQWLIVLADACLLFLSWGADIYENTSIKCLK